MSQPVKLQALNRAGGFHHAMLFMWALAPLQAAPQGVICPFRDFPGFGAGGGCSEHQSVVPHTVLGRG